jgi:hypothetical protein
LFNTIGQSAGSKLVFDYIEENLKELIEKLFSNIFLYEYKNKDKNVLNLGMEI